MGWQCLARAVNEDATSKTSFTNRGHRSCAITVIDLYGAHVGPTRRRVIDSIVDPGPGDSSPACT